MILDRENTVSNGQALTTGTIVSTDTIDLSQARNIGAGEELHWHFNVGTAFSGGTSVQPQIITSANANLSSPTVVASGPAVPTAQLTAGASFSIPMPRNIPQGTGQRFLGIQYVIVGTYSAGTITASLVKDVQDRNLNYPSGFSVT